MKMSTLLCGAITTLTNTVSAKPAFETTFIHWPRNGVTIGQSYNIVWHSTQPHTVLELALVREGNVTRGDDPDVAWTEVETLISNAKGYGNRGSYRWTPDESTPTGEGYGLWIDTKPKGHKGGYADLTTYFDVTAE